MKRGKDDDKITGPMFPRLHVNDTEKGGPRAPPRNKMALYEQLTVPSQRYSSGSGPPNSTSNFVPSTSTNQGIGHERNMYFTHYRTPSSQSYDELQVRQPEALSLSNEPTQVENMKKLVEEDDFAVPIFSQPGIGHGNGKSQNSVVGERHTHLTPNDSMALLSNANKQANKTSSGDPISRQHVISRDNFFQGEYQQKHRLSSSEKADTCLHGDHEENLLAADTRYGEATAEPLLETTQIDISLTGYGMSRIDNHDHSLERENVDRGNEVSEMTMVDSVSEQDISPDDVVGVIGRKHFWKARTAIINQQRVFAVQVFELHRLIKVQKLIAESPDLLLEGNGFVGKASRKDATVNRYSSEYAVKAVAHNIKQKDDSQKPTDKMEGTAENAVAKTPAPPQNMVQPGGYLPFSANPASLPPVNTDPKLNPWRFSQPAPHQWLVPVMSPSEGLVYKPYPAPGLMGPVCVGCGPAGPTYGMPPHHHYPQGIGAPPPSIQGYFPSYPMPMMSPCVSGSVFDHTNRVSGLEPFDQAGQPAAGSVNQGLQRQSSCNITSQKNGTSAEGARPPREQVSTASSPNVRGQGNTEGRDVLPLFPTNPNIEAGAPTGNQSRVIRVVPHNRGSTKESAARIFQSIQAERQQNKSS